MKIWDLGEAKEYLEKVVSAGEIPGFSLCALTKDESESFVYGSASIIPEVKKLEKDMLYDLASLTKVVSTTTITLKCIEKGFLSLDTKICEVLKDCPYPDVTIKHILTHTSGIIYDDKEYKKLHGKEEIKKFIFKHPLSFAPGTKVEYSDFGYVVLGFVIEELVGEIDEVARSWIFEPLEMKNTFYTPLKYINKENIVPCEDTKDRGLAWGEVHDGKAYRLDGLSGNAGLFSNAEDLSHFVQMLLNNGLYKKKRILSPSTINNLKKCYTERLNLRRTLGWFVNEQSAPMGDYYSERCLFHTGFTGTSIYVDFDREVGIILLTNRIHPSRDNLNIAHIRNICHNLLLKSYDEGKEVRKCQ